MMMIDPGVMTLVQSSFLQQCSSAFTVINKYAINLLYLFTVLEITLFGIGWALQQDTDLGSLFFKVIKIGVIFFIIQNYPTLLNIIINSFSTIAGHVVGKDKLEILIFNPAQIWQYGYDVGLHLLQSATVTSGLGLTLILILLGFGILMVFALIGIQMILQLVTFYVVALVGLIILPFGVFGPSRKMFDKVVQSVFQAGVRVMVIIIVLGTATIVWGNFDFREMATTMASLNQFLGLFFVTLLFLFLAIYLPRFAAMVIGEINCADISCKASSHSQNAITIAAADHTACANEMAALQVATTVAITATAGQSLMSETSAVAVPTTVVASAIPLSGSADLALSGMLAKDRNQDVGKHDGKFSSKTLKKLKEALTKIEQN